MKACWYACREDRRRLGREICRVARAEAEAFALRREATRNHATVCKISYIWLGFVGVKGETAFICVGLWARYDAGCHYEMHTPMLVSRIS